MPSPSSRRSLLADRVLSLITEEWQDAEAIMEKATPLVPPGKALRTYAMDEAKNNANRQARIDRGEKTIARKPPPTEHERIRRGARRIINDILASARDTKVIEVQRGNSRFERQMRLHPARRYSHHCCLHGGSCAATDDRQPDAEEAAMAAPEPEAPTTVEPTRQDVLEWLEAQGVVTTVTAPGSTTHGYEYEQPVPETPPYRFKEYR